MEGAEDEQDVLPDARDEARIVVTSDVKDFGGLDADEHAGLVLLYDDTMPAYQIASGLLSMIDAYGGRERFGGREELDAWV